jgi:hypothetical protein
MSGIAVAIGGAAILGAGASIYSGNQAAKASANAAAAQTQAAQAGIAATKEQFDQVVQLMAPYREAGYKSINAQLAMTGQMGPEAQAQEIQGILQGPQYGTMVAQGENAIRQNASATGGLRGGNIQAALAKFRPELLNSLIQQQFGNLNAITGTGQAAASNQAQASQQTGQQIAGLYGNIGSAQAAGAIGQGQAAVNMASGISQSIGGTASMFGIGRLAKIW